MDPEALAIQAQIEAALKQNEATLAVLAQLQDFSVAKTLQAQNIDPAEFTTWVRAQVPPAELADIDREVARQMDDMQKDLQSNQGESAPATKPARRRNMV